jgi:hypothetical protein
MKEEGSIEVMRSVRDALAESFFPDTAIRDDDSGPDIFGDLHTTEKGGMNCEFRSEFGKYLKAVRDMSMTGEPECLTWWRDNHDRFPLVAHVARSILSAQASSAESERLFSVGAHVINKWRTRLSGPHAEKLILLSKQLRRQIHCTDENDELSPDSDGE